MEEGKILHYAKIMKVLFKRKATKDIESFEKFVLELARKFVERENQVPHLFRYSKADYNNIRNIEKEQLFLNPIGDMNDAFEGLAFGVGEENEMLYKESAYIKSFSETKDDLLMWAHYADSYSGICVEYDFNKLDREILWHLCCVIYRDEPFFEVDAKGILDELHMLKRNIEDDAVQSTYEKLVGITSMFLIKPKEWEYEKEWRIVVTYPQMFGYPEEIGDEFEYLYKVRERKISVKDCISSIYIGPKIDSEKQCHISEIAKKLDVPVYQMKLKPNEFRLSETEVKE